MFYQRFGDRRPKDHSLTHIYTPILEEIDGTGRNNSGILVVKRAYDGLKCVEKRFRSEYIDEDRAEFEMFILQSLAHRNIVEYVDAFIDDRGPWSKASLFMGYADLGNLENYYKSRLTARKPPFREVAMWDLFAQLVDAVAYLQFGIRKATSTYDHDRLKQREWIGVVHRDIKPANIFLRTQINAPFPNVLLGDFGQAIRDDNRNWERAHRMGGDPAWSPPEYPDYIYESDIWSIGATMQATCAMRSFTSDLSGSQSATGTCRHFSSLLNNAILSTMRTSPLDRPEITELAMSVGSQARFE
ncbi:MAG: hypothetical protein Q9195_008653 [Heterodermia aff. obscurata]